MHLRTVPGCKGEDTPWTCAVYQFHSAHPGAVLLQLFIGRSRIGCAFRAASDDGVTAALMGSETGRLYGLAMALSLAIEAVIIGGLGSLWGTLVGGVILGVAQTVAAAVAAVLVIGLIALGFSGEAGFMRSIVEFTALLVLAQMWNLLGGYAGLVSIGQQAYVGLGGYALVVLADDLGVNPFVAVPLAGLDWRSRCSGVRACRQNAFMSWAIGVESESQFDWLRMSTHEDGVRSIATRNWRNERDV